MYIPYLYICICTVLKDVHIAMAAYLGEVMIMVRVRVKVRVRAYLGDGGERLPAEAGVCLPGSWAGRC